MRIYISHPSSIAYQAELYEPLRQALSLHELVLPHAKQWVDTNSYETLRGVDLVIAEVSEPSTGQGIELGWADAIGVPIVAIHRADAKPSTAIRFVAKKMASYKDSDDLDSVVRTLVTAME